MFERGTDGPLVVLAGVDGSPSSMRAAAYAAGLARRQRSLLVLVYVQPGRPPVGTAMFAGYLAGLGDEIAAELQAEITQAAAATRDVFHVRYEFVVRRGDAFAQLSAAAHELKADAVVVGASESVGHRFAGSLANRLIRAGHWPVTVVP